MEEPSSRTIAREGSYYVTEVAGRSQPYALRRQSEWRNDRHAAERRDRTLGFYASRGEALMALRLRRGG